MIALHSLLARMFGRVSRTAEAPARSRERGQVVVIVAVGMVVIVAMVGLVIDGGYAWGKQRDTQNAADASAESGAVTLAERLAGQTRTDTDVWTRVEATGLANNVPLSGAPAVDPATECVNGAPPSGGKVGLCGYYTDINGTMLLDVNGNNIAVGSLGASVPPALAAGVRTAARQSFETFLARVIGFTSFDTTAPATAVAGYVQEICPASLGCAVLPVAIPVNVVSCDGNGSLITSNVNYVKNSPTPYVVPLCKNDPGNVGWLDWTPPAGGTSELITAIGPPTTHPSILVPSWRFVTSTGNVNSAGVETALRGYDGQVVLIPQFDGTCDIQPNDPASAACPSGQGNGQQNWYHLPQFAAFQLCGPDASTGAANWCAAPYTHGAYVNGTYPVECGTKGGTTCLVGRFVDFLTNTTITGNVGANAATGLIGVQLIR